MNICVDGVTREATPQEEAELEAARKAIADDLQNGTLVNPATNNNDLVSAE